ncbi:cytochrome P450 [Aspergillus eucalypticola CBS 122712]|uniref:Cytochrome P450 n=1 Tax=Aspergillus eucalypticola (strain CBS 122712 / IBT 29274) TaxID=1448314 RepID=A0A317VLP2_ASPEC|nr:cytochrome P450 [Aspergillus eucalypticola CBS 122712]PWY74047.1 cytochrome P450 [Aspergillus eucalypticola CBS 122712]
MRGTLVAAILILLFVLFTPSFIRSKQIPNAPIFGYRSFFEPTFLLQGRFILGARHIIHDAYTTMRGNPFVLRRWDVDFLVLPMRYLEEVRLISPSKLSSKGAQTGNLAPEYTSMQFLYHSNLHLDVLKKKLIPDLYNYVDKAKEELVYGWERDLPHTDEWTLVSIENHLRMLVARMTAKVFMGAPTCRDPDWLRISIDFSVDLFTTAFTIKMFPPWLYGIVARLVPARYRTFRQLKTGRQIVGELTQRHRLAQEKRLRGEAEDEEDTLLNWMLDHGTPSEVAVDEMGARQCVLTLASIHTTASNVSNMLYDLCTYPEWFAELRAEVLAIAEDLGGPPGQENPPISAKEWCTRLDKLDSFFVESQRHSPVLLLNPQRLAYEDIALRDGTLIPKGSRLAFANYEHSMDPAVYSDPQAFDPMRSYRKRMAHPDQRDRHKAGMTHPDNLAFGYGNQACAGRQFAVAEIKLIMARLLYDFEFDFSADQRARGRPQTLHVNENCFTDQGAKLLMRKRRPERITSERGL